MSKLVDRLRSSLASAKLEQALELAIAAWRDQRGIALAEVVDAIDAIEAMDPKAEFAGSHNGWLTAARKAKTNRDRGALLRAITKRTSGELVPAMQVALKWDDPRLSTQIIALLNALPFSGTRTRDVWRDVFEIAAKQADPRFLALASSLPATWNVGANTKKYLTNRLAEANESVEPVELAPDDEAALRAFVAELAKSRPPPPANEDALLAAIYANPNDDTPRLVYSDWLQERGDPRGEFIALQLQPTRDAASEKRMRALLKANKKAWLGPLAPVLGGDIEFKRGFVSKGTVKFRHQRDAEQHGSHPAWATVEELDWGGQIVRDDQVEWAHYIHPAMSGLRNVEGAHPQFLIAATTPWQIETLVIERYDLTRDMFRALCESPMLPKLRRIMLGSEVAPDWLDGLSRCPAELEIYGQPTDATAAAWLDAAGRSPLQQLTMQYWIVKYRFTRAADGAFTRLDVDVYPSDPITSLDQAPPGRERADKGRQEARPEVSDPLRRPDRARRGVRPDAPRRRGRHTRVANLVQAAPTSALKSLVSPGGLRHKSQPRVMPKVKTHSGAKKRFKKTASGKFKFAHAFKRHLLTGRSQKRKRQARNGAYVPPAHHHQIDILLPYA